MNKIIFKIVYISNVFCIFAAFILMIASCTKNVTVTPKFNTVTPGSGAGGDLITATGSGLSGIRSVVFDLGNVPAALNPDFNTDGALLFRVPINANVGAQNIVFTNASGYQFSIPFTVVAVPSLTSAFPTEWEAGNTITITGNYLASASHVAFTASDDTATIISATATQLVIQMPSSSVPSTKLVVYNDAGATTTSFSLINMDQQLKFFTEGYGPTMQDWSWDHSSVSTDFAVSGTTSLKETFDPAGFQGQSFHDDNVMNLGDYQYLSLWIKGGSTDNTFKVFPDAVTAGDASLSTNISVPAGIWTHITIPMSVFSGVSCQRFDFQITGPDDSQTLYFDNVILVKQ